jgi:CO dehydrogenase maturation factor
MSTLIAISGKGGVGKTTIAALLVRRLVITHRTPVLAVDADPNSCLDAALGVHVSATLGRIREEAKAITGNQPDPAVSKQELLRLKLEQCLVEAKGFDLVAMGRSEGPGCYCYANNVLRAALGELLDHYPYAVLDNEAGLENLSRRIVPRVSVLVMVSDASASGLATVVRLHQLAREMGMAWDRLRLIVNRATSPILSDAAQECGRAIGTGQVLVLPHDSQLAQLAEQGGSIMQLAETHPAFGVMDALLAPA